MLTEEGDIGLVGKSRISDNITTSSRGAHDFALLRPAVPLPVTVQRA